MATLEQIQTKMKRLQEQADVMLAKQAQKVVDQIRRMMLEHGEAFWGAAWGPLYDVLGGNPLAAMPSLHFATSLMAAHLLTEAGPVEGAIGWSYALTLGFALVYLGEHYLIDLLVGATLTESVRGAAPVVAPAVSRVGRLLQRLERLAHS